MPSADNKSQPVARKKGRGQAKDCGAADLRDALHQIAGQIGDADRRHCGALVGLQERLGQLSHKLDSVRAGLPQRDTEALERIEDGIGVLAERVARFGEVRKWQRVAGGGTGSCATARGPAIRCTGADADAPWDAEAAEALTRVYEIAEAELHGPRAPVRPARRQRTKDTKETSPQPAQAPWQGTEPDHAWLEARLTGITTLLQHALDSIDPDKSLTAINGRLDRFEARFEAALTPMARRSDVVGLILLEAQLRELATEFEHTRSQLARLDTMDEALRDLAKGLEGQRQRCAEAQPLDSRAIETMIDAAADRAAARLVEAMPATAPTDTQSRVEALEELLQDYVQERRRGEEITAGILHTIEDALVRIVDRVDAIDLAEPQPAPMQDQEGTGRDGLEIESARLAEAYAAGARVLGQKPIEFALDAADYTASAPRDKKRDVPRVDPAATVADEAKADAQIDRRPQLLSGMRSKLMAQAMRPDPRSDPGPGPEPNAGAGKGAHARTSPGAHGTRFRALFMAVLLLFGTGYLVVDVFATRAPPSVSQQQPAGSAADGRLPAEAVKPNVLPGSGLPQPAVETKRPDMVPPAGEGQRGSDLLAPSGRRPHVPETVTDDLSQNEGDEDQGAEKPASLGNEQPAAFAATPDAVPAEAGIAWLRARGAPRLGRTAQS